VPGGNGNAVHTRFL